MSQEIDTNTKLRVRLEQVMFELCRLSKECDKSSAKVKEHPKYALNRAWNECSTALKELEERSAR